MYTLCREDVPDLGVHENYEYSQMNFPVGLELTGWNKSTGIYIKYVVWIAMLCYYEVRYGLHNIVMYDNVCKKII